MVLNVRLLACVGLAPRLPSTVRPLLLAIVEMALPLLEGRGGQEEEEDKFTPDQREKQVGGSERIRSTLHCLRLTISTYVAALSIFLQGRLR